MLERWLGGKPARLTGAPAVRRLKSYSAESGYVYQYFYCGQRSYAQGTEFVFEVSADRKTYAAISVFVPAAALAGWEHAHGRTLVANEHYAIAKMALFRAFDARPNPAEMKAPVQVEAGAVEEILAMLNLD